MKKQKLPVTDKKNSFVVNSCELRGIELLKKYVKRNKIIHFLDRSPKPEVGSNFRLWTSNFGHCEKVIICSAHSIIYTLLFIGLGLLPLASFSQEGIDTNIVTTYVKKEYLDSYINQIETKKAGEGEVSIIQDYRIKNLVNKQIRIDEKTGGVQGYRIQIFFDSGSQARIKANEVKARFLSLYPNQYAYLTYEQPFFKIRVGDFRNMLEAQGFKNIVLSDFPNAFIVSDKIKVGY